MASIRRSRWLCATNSRDNPWRPFGNWPVVRTDADIAAQTYPVQRRLRLSKGQALLGAEQTVARVAEARADVAALVEAAVQRRAHDRDVGLERVDRGDAL